MMCEPRDTHISCPGIVAEPSVRRRIQCNVDESVINIARAVDQCIVTKSVIILHGGNTRLVTCHDYCTESQSIARLSISHKDCESGRPTNFIAMRYNASLRKCKAGNLVKLF